MIFWSYLEWIGTILGLSGSLLMASKKVSHSWGWTAWIISSILFVTLFSHTGQWGLMFMNLVGLCTCSLGFWQWSTHKEINKKAMNIAFVLSQIALVSAIVLLLGFIFQTRKELIEWFGALLSISGTMLLASKHNKAAFSWIIWCVGNMTLLGFGIYNNQWGFATLQLGFTISNIYGTIMWLIIKDKKNNPHTQQAPLLELDNNSKEIIKGEE